MNRAEKKPETLGAMSGLLSLNPLITPGLTCALALSLLTGCVTILDELVSRRCEINPPVRASDTRRSILFAENFVYVHPEWSAEDVVSYVNSVMPRISRFLDMADKVFARNGAQIVFLRQPVQIVRSEILYILNQSSVWGPDPEDDAELRRIISTDSPTSIPINWSRYLNSEQFRNSGGVSAADWPYVLMYGTEFGGSDLSAAHELGHYFGLQHYRDRPGNLMNDENLGDRLDRDQIEIIWRQLNGRRSTLATLTCDAARGVVAATRGAAVSNGRQLLCGFVGREQETR